MALTPLHVQDICYGNASKGVWSGNPPCRYLTNEMVGKEYKQLCLKHAPGIIDKMKQEGHLPSDFSKRPDNCNGYKYMKHLDQGYNI